ncbi:transposase [Streptomyces sp. NPDC003038]|uniref:IS701 family transposase n=1 Tax=unclassified Streptomyces TaxID=2593676 RepID=UPI00339F2F23
MNTNSTTGTTMTTSTSTRPGSDRQQPGRGSAAGLRRDAVDDAVEELCAAVFTSLRRRDQRERGRQYVRGLLAAQGRKSIRNIAQQIGPGGPAAEQALHHFIAGSTWDWQPIRSALTQYLGQTTPLNAWVAQPMAIPKGGDHSVGVGHRFDPHQGQMFRGQQAFGTWFTSAGVTTPVGWRLFLPDDESEGCGGEREQAERLRGGLREHERELAREHEKEREQRQDPTAPESEQQSLRRPEESYEACAVTGVLESVRDGQMSVRPVVLDIRDIATRSTLNRFAEARVPVVARVSSAARLLVTDPALPGFGAGTLSARDILQNVRGLRMPVEWADPDRPGVRRSSLVAAVRVMVPDPAPGRRREVLLFGEWPDARRLPTQLWVTDMTRTQPGALVRMTKQARRVAMAAGESVREVGLRDFSGRSLPGWHRHVTLASIAHAALALGGGLQLPAAAPAPVARPVAAPHLGVPVAAAAGHGVRRPAASAVRAHAALAGR